MNPNWVVHAEGTAPPPPVGPPLGVVSEIIIFFFILHCIFQIPYHVPGVFF